MANGFFKGVKAELKKVVWPTKQQLVKNTVMVITLVILFSVIILGFDMILEFVDEKLWNVISNKLV
jgi:preprotein translocase subunit SecE